MRLRNIPRAEQVLSDSSYVIREPETMRGRWSELFPAGPLQIEIGMGKGHFLLTRARRNPAVNYIGIERYSSVLLRAVESFEAEQADCPDPEKCRNLRFICMDAADIVNVFAPGEINRIFLNFSDPWPKARHARRRLTSQEFLRRYDRILKAGGGLEFKTDNRPLFDFSIAEITASKEFSLLEYSYDLHHDALMNKGNIMTEYEEKFSAQGNPIFKLTAQKNLPE